MKCQQEADRNVQQKRPSQDDTNYNSDDADDSEYIINSDNNNSNDLSFQIQTHLNISSLPSSSPSSSLLDIVHPLSSSSSSTTAFICDAWYGFPKQKRPRQERILAVSRQIFNYITWNNQEYKEKIMSISSTSSSSTIRKNSNNKDNNNNKINILLHYQMMKNVKATIYVIGNIDDVHAIQERVDELSLSLSNDCKKNKSNKSNADEGCSKELCDTDKMMTKCYFLPGVQLEDLCDKLVVSTRDKRSEEYQHQNCGDIPLLQLPLPHFKGDIVYLSPDASMKLNPEELPPSIVIIGMLVDRKVQNNRSKCRAEQIIEFSTNNNNQCPDKEQEYQEQQLYDNYAAELETNKTECTKVQNVSVPHFSCARLPLDALNVSDLNSNEALNIDTVLEMVQRWWYNCVNSKVSMDSSTQSISFSDSGIGQKLFVDAAARALLTHRSRHPNRTLHSNR